MSLIDETAVASANLAGLRTLSNDQLVPFSLYQRYVLPLDGYVYWLRVNEGDPVRGSIHVTADKRQLEDETIAVNRVVMTTGEMVQAFNDIGPDQMWIGEIAGVRFAFRSSGPRYKVAGLYHYWGEAVYPALTSQLVDNGAQLSAKTLVTSSSLPLWLSLKTYDPVLTSVVNPAVTLYPAFLVPDNLRPPYGTVYVMPDSTTALQDFPSLGHTEWRQHQLVSDRVRITLYGLTNDQVMDFARVVYQYSENEDLMGIMNDTPAVRNPQRTQAELGVLAMKQTLMYTVSYYQHRANEVARQLITQASVAIVLSPDGPDI